jgi:hypothetical protein
MSSGRNLLLERGRRRARVQRPATLIYRGYEIPCSAGPVEFFEVMHPDGAGFISFKSQLVGIIRADIPKQDAAGNELNIVFKLSEDCAVRDDDSGDIEYLKVGDNNSTQAAVIILNLKTDPA